MGAFEYVALDGAGKEKRGILEGDTPRHVRQMLRERSLLPLKITESAEKESRRQSSLGLRRGLSANDLALLTRQLATLVQAGLPLEEALLAVGQQSEKQRVQSIVLGVRSKVMEGHSLADGLGDFPQAFPDLYRATAAAGEQSGHLDAVLERLADYTESQQALSQQMRNAMIYPIVMLVFVLAIVVAMLAYVVPQVVEVFTNSGGELPLLTRIVIAMSDFVRDWWWAVVIGSAGLIALVRWFLSRDGPKRVWHGAKLRLPVFGRISRGFNTAQFTRTLGILAGSGVPVLEALRISGEVIDNVPMREAVGEASSRIREGAGIARSLGASKLFPPMTIHLLSSGEASGELEAMLDKASGNQEREIQGLIAAMLGLLQPLIVVIMGIVVLLIVLAILLPLFQ
ncbi:MAG: type II secretion system inner membrane protein GspF, partial [Pseudomonadota bacterium]